MTEPEKRLWFKLRRQQLGFYYRRQHGIGPFIVDFFCPKLKLVIEIDGETHIEDKQQLLDKKRNQYLSALGIITLRFYNSEIMKNIDGVLEKIIEYKKIPIKSFS